MTTQPPLYPKHIDKESYYAVPLDWLAQNFKAIRVDTCDLLLYHTYDGQVIFDEELPENWPQQPDLRARLRGLFSRQTYSDYKNQLIREGLLHDYDRKPSRTDISKQVQRELSAGIKYVWDQWPPPDPLLYRPRDYLRRRWPVWLGTPDPSSRLALIALLALHNQQSSTNGTGQVQVSWSEVRKYAETIAGQNDDVQPLGKKLRKGLDELRYLGLVEPTEQFEVWCFDPARMAHPPTWPDDQLAEALRLSAERDKPLLALVRDLMMTCCEPVIRLSKVRNAINQAYRPYLLTSVDIRLLHNHVRRQRSRSLLKYDRVLKDYVRQVNRQGPPELGPSFTLRADSVSLVDRDDDGTTLRMPVKTYSGLNDTHIVARCVCDSSTPRDSIAEALNSLRLFVWQEDENRVPTLIPLPLPPATETRIRDGFIIRGNYLHGRLDYSRPFELLTRCAKPLSNLELRCTIRVVHAPAGKQRSTRNRSHGPMSPTA